MKKDIRLLISWLFFTLVFTPAARANDFSDDFNSTSIKDQWFVSDTSKISLTQSDGIMHVTLDTVGKSAAWFGTRTFPDSMDLSANPKVAVRIKSNFPFELRCALWTHLGENNYNGTDLISRPIPGDGLYHTYYFDFSEFSHQPWANSSQVDFSKIHLVNFYVNLTSINISGTFDIDEVKIGDDAEFTNDLVEDYSNLPSFPGWSGESNNYSLSLNEKLTIAVAKASNDQSALVKTFAPNVLDAFPFVQLDVKSTQAFSIGAQVVDAEGKESIVQILNYTPVAEITTLTFDFSSSLRIPSANAPNATEIVKVKFIVNPDGAEFSGAIDIFKLAIGKSTQPEGYEFRFADEVGFSNFYLGSFSDMEHNANSLKIEVGPDGTNLYRAINHIIPDFIDVSKYPYLTIRIRASEAVTLRVDLSDSLGNSTNALPIIKNLSGGAEYENITFDFSEKFSQSWPNSAVVDPTSIRRILYFPEPGGNKFNGFLEIESVRLGSKADEPAREVIVTNRKAIKINQVGYFPDQTKNAIVQNTDQYSFTILDESDQVVYTGLLSAPKYWLASKEYVKVADFSSFNEAGTYRLVVAGLDTSYTFTISNENLEQVSKDVVKAFYYLRTGTEIESEYAGPWARPIGHPDTEVLVHASATTAERPAGSIISSPGGWYDAGDVNKYIVNSAVACYDLLAIYERYEDYFEHREWNIPETGNNLPDILDETKYNLDWMLTMQDLDGGVYHKLTSAEFNWVYQKPSHDTSTRFVVKKSTPATLDFAAVMAQAYRIYIRFPQYTDYAKSCLAAAERAYAWAKVNNNVAYNQTALNTQFDPDINTGMYGENYTDSRFADEFFWAATELAIATQDPNYIADINFQDNLLKVMDWPKVYGYALLSLSHYGDLFPNTDLKTNAVNSIDKLATSLTEVYKTSAYKNSMRLQDFVWGSNTYAANEVMILTEAYRNSLRQNYLEAAIGSMDYILGKNPTGYSYISGAGTRSSQNLYMTIRLSLDNPVQMPGFMAGGPHLEGGDACHYEYQEHALNYSDTACSYSTNEIAINWNASVAYVTNALNALMTGNSPETGVFEKGKLLSVYKHSENAISVSVYPNPAKSLLKVKTSEPDVFLEILNAKGQSYLKADLSQGENNINLNGIESGVYLIRFTSKGSSKVEKLVINH